MIRDLADQIQQHVRLKSRPYNDWYHAKARLLAHVAQDDQLEYLKCDVIPEQPLLVLRDINLVHMSVMLYHGER